MRIIRDIAAMRAARAAMVEAKQSLALVPTMGALHEGHVALVEAAQSCADRVLVSIFVNPMQFGAGEDYTAYPRDEERDIACLTALGVEYVWMPSVEAVYPSDYRTEIRVSGLSDGYCGAVRRGHFAGVAAIVTKLFNQTVPDYAIFGEKDWQQLAIIRQLVRDLDFPIEVCAVPIVRELDGLAMSSRNAYLSASERAAAAIFPKALREAAAAIGSGAGVAEALGAARAAILAGGFASVDYIELVAADSLARQDEWSSADGMATRILAAARIGKARLIDNIAV